MSAEFCDTNVLVYAYDVTAGSKRETALALIGRLWEEGSGANSVQVLQELFVTLTRKVTPLLAHAEARAVVADFAAWQVFQPGPRDVLAAVDAVTRWQISFWDAMVLTAARGANCDVVWSEDLNDGQDYDGVVVRNPFIGVDKSPLPGGQG
jgi:predicted nucleic acid-binding protein